jgi:hypothetical protein
LRARHLRADGRRRIGYGMIIGPTSALRKERPTMLVTVVLLLLCALTAIAGVPLILKLVPPNEIYGLHTEKTLSRSEIWFEVNRFAGWALVAAAALTALAVMIYSGTLLRPFWRQFLVFLVMVGGAVGTSFWYERHFEQYRKRRKRRAPVRSGAA